MLLDPYAEAIFFPPTFERGASVHPGSNLGKAPLGLLRAEEGALDWGDDPRPRHESDLVIYELHVRGFTRHPDSGVAPERQGTFLGLIEKIPYLRELGVTAVELMPVFQWDPQEGNYWGYMRFGTGPRLDPRPDSRTLAFCLRGASQGDDDLYVMINASAEERVFTIQDGAFREWRRVIDTALESPDDIREPGDEAELASQDYRLRAQSVVVLSRCSG